MNVKNHFSQQENFKARITGYCNIVRCGLMDMEYACAEEGMPHGVRTMPARRIIPASGLSCGGLSFRFLIPVCFLSAPVVPPVPLGRGPHVAGKQAVEGPDAVEPDR